MNNLRENRDDSPPDFSSIVERRRLLRFGTLLTAVTGAFAVSSFNSGSASAAAGDKNPNIEYVPTAEKGTASGVATLDTKSKIPAGQLPDLSATYATVSTVTKIDVNPHSYGARGDYTGRYNQAGTGTDNRQSIQAALNAASDIVGSDYYSYLNRRSVEVKLLPGTYLLSSPSDGTPPLIVPAGVTFDFSAATLVPDYPPSSTMRWCAIEMRQYSNVKPGKIYPSNRVPAPDAKLVYDGIRMVHTDNNSRIIGYSDTEIRGFQGAQVRTVGAWISYIKGIRFYGGKVGFIASNGSEGNEFGYAIAPGGSKRRVQTDLRFEDCLFINEGEGGFLGTASGQAPDVNAADNSDSGLTLSFIGCVFESIGTYALHITNAFTVTMFDCGLEEVGKGDGMVWLDNVRSFTAIGTRVNLAGRTVPSSNGSTIQPFPASVFKLSSVQNFAIDGLYCHNTWNTNLKLASGTAAGYRISGVYCDAYDFSDGPMYQGKGTHSIGGRWDRGMFAIGSHRLWNDANGLLRHKAIAPNSDFDGDAYLNTHAVAVPLATGTYYVITPGQLGSMVPKEECEQATSFIAGRSTMLAGIAISVASAGGPGTKVRLGLRARDGSMPGALLLDAGTVDASSPGVKHLGVQCAVVEGNLYFVTMTVQGSGSTQPTFQAAFGAHDPKIGSINAAAALSSTYAVYNASGATAAGLPASQTWVPGAAAVRLAISGN